MMDDLMDTVDRLRVELATAKERLATVTQERDRVKEDCEVGLQISGSFFSALKPILTHVDVQNPGQHITDLIQQTADLTSQLATARREVWEAAARVVERPEANDDIIVAMGTIRYRRLNELLQRRADECREQAKKEWI